MTVTGLTSAGASLFVEKMVQSQILIRKDNPKDRRNVLISLTPEGAELLRGVDDRLDDFILDFFHTCSEKDLITVGEAMKIISEVLEKGTSSKQA
jgi:DNA-binding MarR family transcriptional regulator